MLWAHALTPFSIVFAGQALLGSYRLREVCTSWSKEAYLSLHSATPAIPGPFISLGAGKH
jgi:hypothetical protein